MGVVFGPRDNIEGNGQMRVATKASDFEVSATGIERPGQVNAGPIKLTWLGGSCGIAPKSNPYDNIQRIRSQSKFVLMGRPSPDAGYWHFSDMARCPIGVRLRV
jgi:hypothetical protein